MSTNTATTAPASQRCKGACKEVLPLSLFYQRAAPDNTRRHICMGCWKALNAAAHIKRQEQRQRRKVLLGLSKTHQRPT